MQDILGIQQGITDDDTTQAHKELEEAKMKLQVHEKESQKLDEKIECLHHKLASLRAGESKGLELFNNMEALNQLSMEKRQLGVQCQVLKQIQKEIYNVKNLLRKVNQCLS